MGLLKCDICNCGGFKSALGLQTHQGKSNCGRSQLSTISTAENRRRRAERSLSASYRRGQPRPRISEASTISNTHIYANSQPISASRLRPTRILRSRPLISNSQPIIRQSNRPPITISRPTTQIRPRSVSTFSPAIDLTREVSQSSLVSQNRFQLSRYV